MWQKVIRRIIVLSTFIYFLLNSMTICNDTFFYQNIRFVKVWKYKTSYTFTSFQSWQGCIVAKYVENGKK